MSKNKMSQPLINITRKQALLFAGFLVLYQFLTYIANDMIMPGMIDVVSAFHAPQTAIATSLTAYVLGGASLQLLLGPLSDCYGRRPVMLTGTLLFLVFTLFIATSHSINQFLLARFFEGMGLCFTAVVGYSTLQEIFEEMHAVRLVAILYNVASLAPLIGPLAGASFILYFSWRGIFLLIALLSLVALWGIWRFMPEPVNAVKKDGHIIPKIPLTPKTILNNYWLLLTDAKFMAGAITLGCVVVPCIAWIAISPIILVTNAGLSVMEYALWQLPVFGAGLLGNWALGRLTRRYSIKPIILIGSLVTVAGLFFTALLPWLINDHYLYLMPGLTLYGFGIGVVTSPLSRYVLFSTNVSKGTAYALMSMISMCVQAIGVEAANQVYTTHDNIYFGLYCIVMSLVVLLSLAGTFYFPRRTAVLDDFQSEIMSR